MANEGTEYMQARMARIQATISMINAYGKIANLQSVPDIVSVLDGMESDLGKQIGDATERLNKFGGKVVTLDSQNPALVQLTNQVNSLEANLLAFKNQQSQQFTANNIAIFDKKMAEQVLSRSPSIILDIKMHDEQGNPRSAESIIDELVDKKIQFFIADEHSQTAPKKLALHANKKMAESGGGMFYPEAGDVINDVFRKLKGVAPKEQAKDETLAAIDNEQVREKHRKAYKDTFNLEGEKAEAVINSHLEMIKSAPQNGIGVGPIEKSDGALSVELGVLGSSHRISTTNYTWTNNIIKWQAATGAGINGMFVGFGGAAHFLDANGESARGLVDNILNIPVICLTKGKEGSEPIIKENVIFIPAGEDYPDLMNNVKESTFEITKPMSPLQISPPSNPTIQKN